MDHERRNRKYREEDFKDPETNLSNRRALKIVDVMSLLKIYVCTFSVL